MVAGSRVFSWFLGLFSIGLDSYWAVLVLLCRLIVLKVIFGNEVLLFYKPDVIYGLITKVLKTEPVGSTVNRILIRSDFWLKPKIKCSLKYRIPARKRIPVGKRKTRKK